MQIECLTKRYGDIIFRIEKKLLRVTFVQMRRNGKLYLYAIHNVLGTLIIERNFILNTNTSLMFCLINNTVKGTITIKSKCIVHLPNLTNSGAPRHCPHYTILVYLIAMQYVRYVIKAIRPYIKTVKC